MSGSPVIAYNSAKVYKAVSLHVESTVRQAHCVVCKYHTWLLCVCALELWSVLGAVSNKHVAVCSSCIKAQLRPITAVSKSMCTLHSVVFHMNCSHV